VKLRTGVVAITIVLLVAAAGAARSRQALLALNGVGPLRLGMSKVAAVGTGWLAQPHSGCPLGGKPYPVTYQLSGSRAPKGIAGVATFDRGKLTDLSFTAGVRTAAGVQPGTTTVNGMKAAYGKPPFHATSNYEDTFGATFVFVFKANGSEPVISGTATGKGGAKVIGQLGIPDVPTCD
jgi:hypothetical protein